MQEGNICYRGSWWDNVQMGPDLGEWAYSSLMDAPSQGRLAFLKRDTWRWSLPKHGGALVFGVIE
jgi:hypothetical protein